VDPEVDLEEEEGVEGLEVTGEEDVVDFEEGEEEDFEEGITMLKVDTIKLINKSQAAIIEAGIIEVASGVWVDMHLSSNHKYLKEEGTEGEVEEEEEEVEGEHQEELEEVEDEELLASEVKSKIKMNEQLLNSVLHL